MMDSGEKHTPILTDEKELSKYNKQGYGIFWCPNPQKDGKRGVCERLDYWIADIDGGNKKEQGALISSLLLFPTFIVESKNGYHCYWKTDGNATFENFKEIEKGLVEKLHADKKCTDTSRLLRVAGYYHMKNPQDPYMVNVVYQSERVYTEKQMLSVYGIKKEPTTYEKPTYKGAKEEMLDESQFERFYKVSRIVEGCRNNLLSQYAFWLKREGFDKNTVMNTILRVNQKTAKPLGEYEVRTIVNSKF